MESIRTLAVARQHVEDVRESTDRERAELEARVAQRVADAEREDIRAYGAATGAGWSADELRKIGFSEPEKKARTRRRASRRSAARTTGDSERVDDAQQPAAAV